MPESLGERIHRMQVEDRNAGPHEIAEALDLAPSFVWPYYAGWAQMEIERLRAENAELRRECYALQYACEDEEEDDAA